MITSHALVRIDNACKYLVQLSKHWSHKFPDLTYDTTQARIPLPRGPCVLAATDGALELRLVTETDDDAALLEQVVADHLKRFAFREQLDFEWARQRS